MTKAKYEVELTKQAQKDLKKLRSNLERTLKVILKLETNSKAGHILSGSLNSARSLEFSLPGIGECRAAYIIIEKEKLCLIFLIGPHENFYKKAERRVSALLKARS